MTTRAINSNENNVWFSRPFFGFSISAFQTSHRQPQPVRGRLTDAHVGAAPLWLLNLAQPDRHTQPTSLTEINDIRLIFNYFNNTFDQYLITFLSAALVFLDS